MSETATPRARARKSPAAEKAPGAATPRPRRKKEQAPAGARGLAPRELGASPPPPEVEALRQQIEADGGSVLATYREPVGGTWAVLAGLPLEKVTPTPFQRDLSEGHVTRLSEVIGKIDRYLDPIVAVRTPEGKYWTPNGNHRRSALERLGARTIVALVLPDEQIAYRILALNTEKAHNVREKALEVIRMARSLAELDPRSEKSFALEFEEPPLLTLGICYEARPRFAGGAYHSVLRQIDGFFDEPLPRALELRQARAELLLELDDAVGSAVASLKERGFESPYLKAFVVARVNPLRFHRGERPPAEAVLAKMLASAQRFDPAAIRPDQVARASGPPPEE